MSGFESVRDSLPDTVVGILNESSINGQLPLLLQSVFHACRGIAENIRNSGYSADTVGTQNDFGDHQLDVDVQSDNFLFKCLRDSGLVAMASSEENPTEVALGGSGYSVGFDPLDGSSIVDCNFAVGTILGVWPGSTLLNRTGREQVCSLVTMYGPRVTIALAFSGSATASGEPISMELTMHPHSWKVSKERLTIAPRSKTFAPGNLRATADNAAYKRLVDYWIDQKYTLRYSGGLVPDVYHILIKGGGVLANASSAGAKAKLRLLYEAAPIALIVEAAGGASCVCSSEVTVHTEPLSLLDVPVSELDKRVGVCYGSTEEVERFKQYLFN